MSEVGSNRLRQRRFAPDFMIERRLTADDQRAHGRRGEMSRSLLRHGLRNYGQMSIDKSDAIWPASLFQNTCGAI
jgi:hypothetical protein